MTMGGLLQACEQTNAEEHAMVGHPLRVRLHSYDRFEVLRCDVKYRRPFSPGLEVRASRLRVGSILVSCALRNGASASSPRLMA